MIKKERLYCLILAGICFFVYANTLKNSFVFDDIAAILESPSILHPLRFWTEPSQLLNSLCYFTVEFNPFLYHLLSIILHSLNSILVFFFLRIFFSVEASFLAACLFAAHPVHTEAVSWVSGKPYLILALFILVVLLIYNKATKSTISTPKTNHPLYILSLAIFSYFMISNYGFYFTFPIILAIVDIVLGRWRENWKLWIPFFCLMILRLLSAKSAILGRISAVANITGAEITQTINPIINFTVVFFSHLWLLLWPAKLTVYHEPIEFSRLMLNSGVIILILLGLIMPFIFKKQKEIFLGIAIFILFFAPIYSFLPVSSLVAERYIYFPSISLSIFAAFLYEKYTKNHIRRRRIIGMSIFLFLMSVYAIRSIVRNRDWKDPESFWKATVKVSYKSPGAFNGMGLVYQEKREIQKAIQSFEKAINIQPRYVNAYNNLGNLYYESGKLEKAEAFFKKAIEINPKYFQAYNNLGNVYSDMGKKDEAIALYEKVLELNPEDPDAYFNLGNVYKGKGRTEEAISAFRKVIDINPRDAKALSNLGALYAIRGAREEAIASFNMAIQVDKKYAPAYFNLCRLYFDEEKYGLAIENCDKAAKLGYKIPPEFLKQLKTLVNEYP